MINRKTKRRLSYVCIAVAAILLLNYLTETIPFSLHASSSEEKVDFTVLCYNIKSKGNGYSERQAEIAKVILNESPDVAFLCEYKKSLSGHLDSIMTKVGHYKSFYRKRSGCIFYSKYDIDSVAAIDVGTSKGKYKINNKVHVLTPHGTITIVGCHLTSSGIGIIEGYKRRIIEADSIYRLCMNEQRPLIVMGDMNDVSGSTPINRIKKAGLKDAWWEGGCGYGATFHGKGLRLRIDHILYDYKGLELVGVKVIGNDLSDHNALIARFRINKH